MNFYKKFPIVFSLSVIILCGLVASCNEGKDCSHETFKDRKTNEQLEMACLADPQDPNFCRLYLIQSVYRPHCW